MRRRKKKPNARDLMNYVQGEDLFGGHGLEQALASGYARQGGIQEGRTEGWAGATQAANRRVVEDSPSAWLIVDRETGAVRANSAKQLFERHRPAMESDFRVDAAEFGRGRAWKRTYHWCRQQGDTWTGLRYA
jgi:hypothetical protein